MHTVTRRPPTEQEQQRLQAAGAGGAGWGCAIGLTLAGSLFFAGMGGCVGLIKGMALEKVRSPIPA